MTDKPATTGKHGGNISCLIREKCSQVFFVYAGGLGMIDGMGPTTFLQKSGLSNRNVAFLRDPKVKYFDEGISDEIVDLEGVIDWHAKFLAENPHITDVYCVGNSFGGWAALFFGYILAVKKVFAFAPAGHWGRDMLADLMKDSNGVTEYEIMYSTEIADDKRFAETYDGYPNVKLFVNNKYDHLLMRGLLLDNALPGILPPFKAAE
jgi:hypothetical protein